LFGRDCYYRPVLVVDMEAYLKESLKNPDLLKGDIFTDCYMFLYNYIRKVMFLPGHIEQFQTIFNCN
jgi:hypothetical protein